MGKLVIHTFMLILTLRGSSLGINDGNFTVDCSTLRIGQYVCPHPDYDLVDPKTQQIRGCRRDNKAEVLCLASDRIICNETNNSTFWKESDCKWTNGYHFETAMLLSVFFGMFGLDRFYLGYPAIGLLKFCTFGFLCVGQLLDIILIATQIVGPADGSFFIMPYYGARTEFVTSNNLTYRKPQPDWGLPARKEL